MVVLDTSIIIDHLRQTGTKASYLEKLLKKDKRQSLAISVISIQELYEGQSTKDKHKEEKLLATISPLRILPYTFEVAQKAGEIGRDLDHPIELADCAIAASAIIYGYQLLTLDKKHFQGIKELEFYSN